MCCVACNECRKHFRILYPKNLRMASDLLFPFVFHSFRFGCRHQLQSPMDSVNSCIMNVLRSVGRRRECLCLSVFAPCSIYANWRIDTHTHNEKSKERGERERLWDTRIRRPYSFIHNIHIHKEYMWIKSRFCIYCK